MTDGKNQTTKNLDVNLQPEALTDSPGADEQANQT